MTLRGFIEESKSIGFITLDNYYMMPLEHFVEIYENYLGSGENLIDDYYLVLKFGEGSNLTQETITVNEYNSVLAATTSIRSLRLPDINSVPITDYCRRAREKINYLRDFKIREENLKRKTEREKADMFISKQSIRRYVFDKYGERCLSCGETNDLAIDHVVPVSRGGKNSLDNLQPLCISCNSRKGNRTIDYRGK